MSKQPLIDQLDWAVTEFLAGRDVKPSSVDASLEDLLQTARELNQMPRPAFKARLRSELERNVSMSTKTVQFRQGFHTVTPYLLPPSADFIDFAKYVFGAEETERTATSATSFHAELRIGDSMLMIGVGANRSMPAELLVYVPHVDEVYRRALEAGATLLEPIVEMHGDRFGGVQDSAGNRWFIATHLGADYIPENRRTINAIFHPEGAAKFIDFVKEAFGGQEVERYDSPEGKVMWAAVRIGDSVVGVSDPGRRDWAQPMQTMIYLYVPDVDAIYDRAIRAGAQSIHPPANQFYGDRNGGVTDAWGNQWYMATPL